MKQINGQLTMIQETSKRDNPIDIIYHETLGWCCPVCKGFGRIKGKYCPMCGQRVNLMSAREYEEKHK